MAENAGRVNDPVLVLADVIILMEIVRRKETIREGWKFTLERC